MAKESKKVEGPATGPFRVYRGFKIKPAVPSTENISIVETRQIEIGAYGSFSVKTTGKEDYYLKVQAQKDNCGISILKKLAEQNGLCSVVQATSLRPEDCGDCSGQPETLQEMRDVLSESQKAQKQIDEMAKKYGLTGDEFIKAFTSGTLESVVKEQEVPQSEEKGE